MKRRAIAALLLFLIGFILILSQGNIFGKVDVYTTCKKNLDESHNALITLMKAHQEERIDKEDEAFQLFSTLFDAKLTSVDLRNPEYIVFSFRSTYPETSIEVIYCVDDRLEIRPDTIITEDVDALRLEHLGINEKGYIYCKRIEKCWFYYESYLPT